MAVAVRVGVRVVGGWQGQVGLPHTQPSRGRRGVVVGGRKKGEGPAVDGAATPHHPSTHPTTLARHTTPTHTTPQCLTTKGIIGLEAKGS